MNHRELCKLLDYNPETGAFRWKVTRGRTAAAGKPAGAKHKKGYVSITVGGERWLAHRLAWYYAHGSIPGEQVDHINGDRADNRLSNLRLATACQNQGNRHGAARHNQSGLLGAHKISGGSGWFSRITVDKKTRYLGCFPTAEAAHKGYMAARRELQPRNTL